jgi:hydroxymethylpyrimidine pyrophosphatase-like HAD family hydrolase
VEAERALKEQSGGRLQVAIFPTRRPEYQGMWALFTRVRGPSKATALEWIAREHGVEMDEVVAVGDWYNDLPMMHAAGLSFAMRQAPESVQTAADEVLDADSAAGGGVAEAARRAGLL